MSREVGLPFANGMIGFARGQYDRAIDELSKIRAHANLFGGSHAQRDIIPLTLIEAALRGGRLPLARAIAAERTELKRTSPFNWRLTERVLLSPDGTLERALFDRLKSERDETRIRLAE